LTGAGIQASVAAWPDAVNYASVAALSGAANYASVAALSGAANYASVVALSGAVNWASAAAWPACCSADFAVGQDTDKLFYPEQLLQRKESRPEKLLK
jgi:hypothetical protein